MSLAFGIGLAGAAATTGCATASTATVGADVSFLTHEAEDPANTVKGEVIRLLEPPSGPDSSPELEASGRAFVALTKPGHFVDFPVAAPADTLVIRHSIPDAEEGGGRAASLSLYVNGQRRQTLMLESRHNWLYGNPTKVKRTNTPGPGMPAHVYWDEARFRLAGPALKSGDRIRLQKDAADDAEFYHIDLIDLESAPAPLRPPSADGWLSIIDFGAGTGDVRADTAAIKACIAAARESGKSVWMPPGRYYQEEQFLLDGVKVRGAGMWHTELIGTRDTSVRDFGFRIAGDGSEVRDLFMENPTAIQRGSAAKAFNSSPSDRAENWRVENVWVVHSHVGFWMSGANNGVVRNCRVRLTYADALTFAHGASNNLIEHNHVRGVGDDGIAILSETAGGTHAAIDGGMVSRNNIVRRNTVVANWWGHNFDLAGGYGHVVEDNYFADNSSMGCLTINLPVPFPMHDLTDSVIRRNVVVRGGGRFTGQLRGAVWIFAGKSAIRDVVFEDNRIIDSLYRGIHLTGAHEQHIRFLRNRIVNPGPEGVMIESRVVGSAVFEGNTVEGASEVPFRNDADAALVVEDQGNTW